MPIYNDNLSEYDILERLKSGENGGYEILYDRYASLLFGIIKRIVYINEDAENLLQDCFVKIWLNINTYDTAKGKLTTWLINIARNTAIDFTRSKLYAQKLKNQSIENIVSPSIEMATHATSTETIGLRQLVNILPPQCREIIEWMYFEGYTQQEISENFNIPLGTVKTRTRLALKELRRHFDLDG
jgi:RNA polymerase sigma-70 factor, ECF subfamily